MSPPYMVQSYRPHTSPAMVGCVDFTSEIRDDIFAIDKILNLKNGYAIRIEWVRFFIELKKFIVPQKSDTVVESKSYNEELRKLCEEYEQKE